MRSRLFVFTVFVSAVTISSFAVHAGNLDEATFQRLHAELQPSKAERWRTIPWKIDLLDAQQTAAKERKPIFIWAMDGHPLGCT